MTIFTEMAYLCVKYIIGYVSERVEQQQNKTQFQAATKDRSASSGPFQKCLCCVATEDLNGERPQTGQWD